MLTYQTICSGSIFFAPNVIESGQEKAAWPNRMYPVYTWKRRIYTTIHCTKHVTLMQRCKPPNTIPKKVREKYAPIHRTSKRFHHAHTTIHRTFFSSVAFA